MADTYVGQIMLFGGTFAPENFLLCDGQLLPRDQYTLLFSVMGSTYGGDGVNNFAVPNLTGRAIVGAGQGPGLHDYPLGTSTGSATVTLTPEQNVYHSHNFVAVLDQGTTQDANGNVLATAQSGGKGTAAQANLYSQVGSGTWTTLRPGNLGATGGNGAHNNMQPYLPIAVCLCVAGYYPPKPERDADAGS